MSVADRTSGGLANSMPGDSHFHAGQGRRTEKYRTERLVSERVERSSRRPGRGPGKGTLIRLLQEGLSERDLLILDELDRHRYLTTHHLQSLCFAGHASAGSAGRGARRVLARLHRDQLVDKPLRRVGGRQAGSSVAVWTLTTPGKRLLNMRAGIGAVGRVVVGGDRRIDHYLAIADTRIALVHAAESGLVLVHRVSCEPSCWRSFVASSGARSILKPDLLAVTSPASNPDVEDHWFFEIDRGTEGTRTVIAQCQLYEAYRNGAEPDDVFPLVVWVVPDKHRAALLAGAIRRSRLASDLYRVITGDELVALVAEGTGGAL